jgi:alkylation response protein AidB-like acyl-CoA dehydrogenase
MDFSLSEEQSLLRDSVERYVRDHCTVERHRKLCQSGQAFDATGWRQFADLGWLAVPFSEADGGLGGGAVDVMVITEALGKGLVREPLLTTVITCGGFLRRGASDARKQAHIPAIIDGREQWAFAFAESSSGYDLAAVTTTAVADAGGYRLNGSKIAVLNGGDADFLVVTARSDGGERSRSGISLFIVDARQQGVTRNGFCTVDGSRGANITFTDVLVAGDALLGDLNRAYPLIETVIDDAIVAMGGEALGAMQVLLDTTVAYTKTREQFGQPIGSFQALQHRMADMYLKVEELRSLLFNAAIQVDAGSDDVASACAALKVKIAEAGKFVSQQAVQLHGGIGMTDELVVGHHYKRLMVLAMLYGDEDYYLQKYTELARRQAS